jgi:hypothetical protein
MRSKLYATYGFYKVWQRPLNKGKGFRFEVRQGNYVLSKNHANAFDAMKDASVRYDAWVGEQARVMKELGELE